MTCPGHFEDLNLKPTHYGRTPSRTTSPRPIAHLLIYLSLQQTITASLKPLTTFRSLNLRSPPKHRHHPPDLEHPVVNLPHPEAAHLEKNGSRRP